MEAQWRRLRSRSLRRILRIVVRGVHDAKTALGAWLRVVEQIKSMAEGADSMCLERVRIVVLCFMTGHSSELANIKSIIPRITEHEIII